MKKSPIQLGKPPYPIHCDEEEKPPKSERKTLMKTNFLPGQAAQGPMVAPAAWQLGVWSLQSITAQGM